MKEKAIAHEWAKVESRDLLGSPATSASAEADDICLVHLLDKLKLTLKFVPGSFFKLRLLNLSNSPHFQTQEENI